MRKTFILTIILSLLTLTGLAQPKFLAKAKKSILTVHTYDQQGKLLHQGTALLVGADGEAVGDYKTFQGAYKAIATKAANSGP